MATDLALRAHLRPFQTTTVEFLLDRPDGRGYVGHDPGLGKTRAILTTLAELGHDRALIVCPAMIRDAQVWQGEVARIGAADALDLQVISYHEMGRIKDKADLPLHDAVVFDEAHRLKNRKTGWWKPATWLADRAATVLCASGSPIPNAAVELYGQMRMLRPDIPAYWKWVESHFNIVQSRWSAYEVGSLRGCDASCIEANARAVSHGGVGVCEHWRAFAAAELDPWMLRYRRDDVLTELPPVVGMDEPFAVPMTTKQARAYKQMRTQFLAEIEQARADGSAVTLETLTSSGQFINLMKLATGLSAADPTALDKESGKLNALAELLADRTEPSLVVAYFRNTADAIARVAVKAGKRVEMIGAQTSRNERARIVQSFQDGEIDVLVGSILVVAEGITLTRADQIILVERSWRPDVNDQVVRRLHRLGQTRPVNVIQMLTPETVDAGQWQVLADKTAHIRTVLGPVEVRGLMEGRVTPAG